MKTMVQVKFVEPWRGWDAGAEGSLDLERARELLAAGVIEADLPPETVPYGAGPMTTGSAGLRVGGSTVVYDQSEQVSLLQSQLADADKGRVKLTGELTATQQQLKAAEAYIEELKARLEQYETPPSPAATEPLPPAPETAVETHTEAPPEDGTPGPDAAPAPGAGMPPLAARPVAGLNIPSGLRGKLIGAGIDTVGKLQAAIADGSVLEVDGIGEAKAAELADHLKTLGA